MTSLLTFAMLMISCNRSSKFNIVTTEDWINVVSSANSVEDIDEAYCSMSQNQIKNIGEELTYMVSHLKNNDAQKRAKCRAFHYIFQLSAAHKEDSLAELN